MGEDVRRVQGRIMSGESYSNWECGDEIICPHCGKRYKPTYDETYIGGEGVECYDEGYQGEFTCDNCGKKFTLHVEMKWEYTTQTIEGE